MSEKLFVSDEAIEKYGYAHFRRFEYDDFNLIATWGEFVELEDGLLLNRDDMDDYYLQVSEDDCSFNDIEGLANKIELAYNTQFFNMTSVCELAKVNYSTFKGWKNNGLGMSEKKVIQLLKAMKEICEGIEIIDND